MYIVVMSIRTVMTVAIILIVILELSTICYYCVSRNNVRTTSANWCFMVIYFNLLFMLLVSLVSSNMLLMSRPIEETLVAHCVMRPGFDGPDFVHLSVAAATIEQDAAYSSFTAISCVDNNNSSSCSIYCYKGLLLKIANLCMCVCNVYN